MDEAFLALLLADPVLSERVGRRIQWGVQPPGETATAYINLQLVSGSRRYSLDGPSRWCSVRVQVDVWADRTAEALTIWRAVENLLSGYSGPVGAVVLSMVRLEGVRGLSERLNETARLTGCSGDFVFSWRPA